MATQPPPADGHRFVVQHHRARRPHYDFRLEAAGVLVSWAVPKGLTLDPDVKRMAVHVDDHPLDYFDFEGVIPAGDYGGGDVIVWDWGTWTLARGDDPLAAVAAGDLHFDLAGEKLAGRFALVRRGGDGREQWLLIKKHDDAARPGWNPEDHPRSVKSGRTNDEVRDAPAATWSNETIWAAATTDEMAELDRLGASGTWRFGGTALVLTDLDAVLFPAEGPASALTKRDLVRHHATRAPVMLPYLADRPVNHDLVVDSPASLVEVAGDGVVGLHPSTTTNGDPGRPTWAVMEIRGTDDEDVLVVARLHRTALEHLGVDARPVLLGDGGMQVWIPVTARYTAAETQRWVEEVSSAIRSAAPDLTAADRISLGPAERLVAPFSARPAPGAPVAVPVSWAELDDLPARWTIRDVGARIERAGDPLAPLIGRRQLLPTL